MLVRKKTERLHAIAAIAGEDRKKELQRLRRHRHERSEGAEEAAAGKVGRGHGSLRDDGLPADPIVLSSEDPAAVLRAIGDHVNTRLQELDFDDELDADLFDEKQRQLREEAELDAGTKVRALAADISDFLRGQQGKKGVHSLDASVLSSSDVSVVCVGHNNNAVTAVCSLGAQTVVLGDKTGAVYIAELGSVSKGKQLLSPSLRAAVCSIAVSDTRGMRPSQRTLFERSTADHSVTSYIAVGAADGTISVWITETRRHMGTLTMHRSAVTGLAFRNDTLYSGGYDEALRVWALPQMSCEDKLFGHTGRVLGLHCLKRERCATVGDDGTMRFWKVDAATQQEFASSTHFGVKVVLECVVMVSDFIVLCGAANGALLVFDVGKRRPLVVREAVHGYGFVGDGTGLEAEAIALQKSQADESSSERRIPNPITAVAAIPYSDVAASASYDGVVRVWHVNVASERSGRSSQVNGANTSSSARTDSLDHLASISVNALVTSLYFPPTSDALFIACSKEPRLGRWVVQRSALNSVLVVPLNQSARQHLESSSRIEHVPAMLYGFDDDGGEGRDTTGYLNDDNNAGRSNEPQSPQYGDHDDVEDTDESSRDSCDKSETGLFTLGEEGQMKFNLPIDSVNQKSAKNKMNTKSKKRGKNPKAKALKDSDVAGSKTLAAVKKKSVTKLTMRGKLAKKDTPKRRQ
uniref:Predicted WD40 repeat protein n=1 Tax=Trypanosoma congolense (strain IL3000) TaxID=1068625 RepID=G0UVQ8_TRYCI|nr:predicted WD40 repeat protein [Trypanosoma congolense IL3000]